eukprot:EG_transcript_11290
MGNAEGAAYTPYAYPRPYGQFSPNPMAAGPFPQHPMSGSPYVPGSALGPGLENAVYDAHKNVLWTPDRLVATALDGQDGQYDGKFFGAKIKVMRQKDGVPLYPGHPAEYGYPESIDPKDPYLLAGVAPGGTAYDTISDTILAPDELTASQLDAADGVLDGKFFGTKIRVKKSKIPAYNPELAKKNALKAAGQAPAYATYARPAAPGLYAAPSAPYEYSYPHPSHPSPAGFGPHYGSGYPPPPAPPHPAGYFGAPTYLNPGPYGGLPGANYQPAVPSYPSDFIYYPGAPAAPTYFNGGAYFGAPGPLAPAYAFAPTYRPPPGFGFGFGAYDIPPAPFAPPLLPPAMCAPYMPPFPGLGPPLVAPSFAVPATTYGNFAPAPLPDITVAYQAGAGPAELSPAAVWGAPNAPTPSDHPASAPQQPTAARGPPGRPQQQQQQQQRTVAAAGHGGGPQRG